LNAANQAEIVRLGGIHALSEALQGPGYAAPAEIFSVLLDFAIYPASGPAIFEAGGMESIFTAAWSHLESSRAALPASGLLFNLSTHISCRHRMLDGGGLQLLLEMLKCWWMRERRLPRATGGLMGALRCLCSLPAARASLVAADRAVEMLLVLASEHEECINVTAPVTYVLQYLQADAATSEAFEAAVAALAVRDPAGLKAALLARLCARHPAAAADMARRPGRGDVLGEGSGSCGAASASPTYVGCPALQVALAQHAEGEPLLAALAASAACAAEVRDVPPEQLAVLPPPAALAAALRARALARRMPAVRAWAAVRAAASRRHCASR